MGLTFGAAWLLARALDQLAAAGRWALWSVAEVVGRLEGWRYR